MKKTLIAISGLVVVGGGLLTYMGGETIDRFNPLVKEKDVYVLTKGEAKPDPEHDGKRYFYMLDGVDESGNKNTIKVGMAGKDKYVDSYLKVHVKGKYVYEFEKVQEKEVPEKAKEKLKN
ncbi:YxeA family protein [Bacillus mycoides]|uniref:YxeA family protein n=1 Tax=Bacillus mycoides TaxID=1405 RepID=UPI001C5EC790|nr:YxeA family protein [Bacillus mycoides]